MDVVDLDKVLDDFELNEDKTDDSLRTHSTAILKPKDVSPKQKHEEYIDINVSENIPKYLTISKAPDYYSNGEIVKPPISEQIPYPAKNNFNVANVFSSLNEYICASNVAQTVGSIAESSIPETSSESDIPSSISVLSPQSSYDIDLQENDGSDVVEEEKQQLVGGQDCETNNSSFNSEDSEPVVSNSSVNNISNIAMQESKDDSFSDVEVDEITLNCASIPNVVPLGFESTMDDVSDNELESYLQELELETKSLEQHVDTNVYSVNKIEINLEECPLNTTDAYITILCSAPDKIESNVDTVSEASTIEINDDDNDSVSSNITMDLNHSQTIQVEPESERAIDVTRFSVIRPNSLDIECNSDIQLGQPGQTPCNLKISECIAAESPESCLDSGTVKTDIAISQQDTSPDLTCTTSISSADDFVDNSDMAVENDATSSEISDSGNVESIHNTDGNTETSLDQDLGTAGRNNASELGKSPPYWIPDNQSNSCMQCDAKFTVIKRRHHCRACGHVLCSKCCSMKAILGYLGFVESRVCIQCFDLLSRESEEGERDFVGAVAGCVDGHTISTTSRQPNPNNPMEYCSVIPPLQQVSGTSSGNSISVMVPVGVLKREGSQRTRSEKNVMFSDGIRPGCDLTELDCSWNPKPMRTPIKRVFTPPGNTPQSTKINPKLPPIDEFTQCYVPSQGNGLPPVCQNSKCENTFVEVENNEELIRRLNTETLMFGVQKNFYVYVKIVNLEECCVNKIVMNFCTKGLHAVGQDEIVILLELDNDVTLPKDVFLHLYNIYTEASKGRTISEMGFSLHNSSKFLNSREHGGFLYIRPTFQCLQGLHLPSSPFLIGVLIHRWEVPWAKIFPLRLMLRLGALYRYYPSPIVSVRGRESVYAEIAHTIINLLADFRNYSYSLASVRGMVIHMEERRTTILIPRNRYDQVIKALNNSSDHILALGGNFSKQADGHLVCIQNTETGCTETNSYTTQAINIQGKPRIVTGASFLVLNESLKSSSGLSGKCSIVEDGLLVQILSPTMTQVRESFRNMKDYEIVCGPVGSEAAALETVHIKWTDNDLNFNVGVLSPIDEKPMDGIPNIRVHGGLDYSSTNHFIRWTDVFIIQSGEEASNTRDPVDISKLSEQVGRSTCMALVTLLDMLATNGFKKIGLRATLHPDYVSYEAGSLYSKLAPLYMNALDNELIPVLHKSTTNLHIENLVVLELIFYILDL